MRIVRLAPVLALLLAGCPDDRIGQAVADFRHFSQHGEAAPREGAVEAAPPVELHVAERIVTEGPRPRLDLVLELPLTTDAGTVRRVLEAAARGDEGKGQVVVRAVAWPGGLRRVVGPYGAYFLARDCKGLEGQAGCEDLVLAGRFGGPVSLEDARALQALDAALLAGLEGAAARAEAARRSGLSEDAVALALKRARKLFPPPRTS